jgi:FkbM family methyltransferase
MNGLRIARVSRIGRLRTYAERLLLNRMGRRVSAQGCPKMAIIAHDTIGDAIVIAGRYEADLLRAITQHILPTTLPGHRDMVAIDVGANIGNHALAFAGAFARVLAFEPNPVAVHLLNANVLLNGCSNITVCTVGLGDKNAAGAFRQARGNLGAGRFVAPTEGERGLIDLQIVTGDDYIPGQLGPSERIGLVKIDVEGLEAAVVAGMSGLLRQHGPLVLFEALDRRAGNNTLALLQKCGYRHFFSIEPARVRARYELLRAALRWIAGADLYMERITELADQDYGLILACVQAPLLPQPLAQHEPEK